MATGATQNYGLNQWEPGDQFIRAEFNRDNQKTDSALAGLKSTKCEAVCGSYAGDGAAGRSVNLGFAPKAVIVERSDGARPTGAGIYGGMALTGQPLKTGAGKAALSVTGSGFSVAFVQNECMTNQSGSTYYYVALR